MQFILIKLLEALGQKMHNADRKGIIECDWKDCCTTLDTAEADRLDGGKRRALIRNVFHDVPGPIVIEVRGCRLYYCEYSCRRAAGMYLLKPLIFVIPGFLSGLIAFVLVALVAGELLALLTLILLMGGPFAWFLKRWASQTGKG